MLTMALIPLIGGGIAIFAFLMLQHVLATRRAGIKTDLDRDVESRIAKVQTLDRDLARSVLDGTDLDAALPAFTKARAHVFARPTESPWLWTVEDDLNPWAEAQLAERTSALNIKGRLVGLALLVGIALAVVISDLAVYNQLASSQPVLSPQAPVKATSLLPALPVSPLGPGVTDPFQTPAPSTP